MVQHDQSATSHQTLKCLELYTDQFKKGDMQCDQATKLKIEQHNQSVTSHVAIMNILAYKFHYQILLYQLNWCIL